MRASASYTCTMYACFKVKASLLGIDTVLVQRVHGGGGEVGLAGGGDHQYGLNRRQPLSLIKGTPLEKLQVPISSVLAYPPL